MRSIAAIVSGITLFACLLAYQSPGQDLFSASGSPLRAHHTQVKLLLAAVGANPGETVLAGIEMKMDPGWHTYWKNPGDAGSATTVQWTLPPGISAGAIRWPLPQKLPPAEVTTYGYEDKVVLIVPLTLASNVAPGEANVLAKVAWLECKDVCIPANETVEAKLNIGSEGKPSGDAATIGAWNSKVPQSGDGLTFQATWEKPASGDMRPLLISLPARGAAGGLKYDSADFFPDTSDNFEIQPATEVRSHFPGNLELRKTVKKFSGDWPQRISGTVIFESGNERYGYDVNLPVATRPAASGSVSGKVSWAGEELLPLWQILFYAFLGGLILNVMPCVLPVIALKILGFVSEARSEPGRVRLLGLVYALGVLVSFLVLAAVVIGLKAAGHRAGWGMQFSSPIFVVCLTTLVLLVALNLFGVFEVTLSGRVMDSAGSLTSRGGIPGAFFNGALATALATPCTAPFLAPALGFAFQQGSGLVLLIFLTVGLGLSAPYLVLSFQPRWLAHLPKPGPWMERFKNIMGFPMLATVVWLYYVASSTYGPGVLWLGIFLVVVALAAWIFGEFFQRGRKHRAVAAVAAMLLLAGGYAFALEDQLDWRAPVMIVNGLPQAATNGLAWQPWSPEAVAAGRAAGKPVLVDFTADWCLTCQVNRKTSLEKPSVREKLKATGALTLVGDYTHSPDAITVELNRYHRAGVPLVLVYPKNPEAPAIVLPALLTPGIVLSALDQAN